VHDPILRVEHRTEACDDGTRGPSDVSLGFAPGEFLVTFGLSGSRTSTPLRRLNRLVAPTSGREVVFDGPPLALMEARFAAIYAAALWMIAVAALDYASALARERIA
jgi:ABC-type proline/glycine betaine transport system ATPase subunit